MGATSLNVRNFIPDGSSNKELGSALRSSEQLAGFKVSPTEEENKLVAALAESQASNKRLLASQAKRDRVIPRENRWSPPTGSISPECV